MTPPEMRLRGDAVTATPVGCFHCGLPCADDLFVHEGRSFCCNGCRAVHEILTQSGLGRFYELNDHPGKQISRIDRARQFDCLDQEEVSAKLLDFTDGRTSRVTLTIPAIHCVACVWLLENLHRLHPGVGRSRVNFPRRQVSICFDPRLIRLSELAALLASIGYEPELTLGHLEKSRARTERRRLHLQVGIAGFAFGNIMIFSLPSYLGLDSFSGPMFRIWFGVLSLLLAAPVLIYSAADWFVSAFASLRRRSLTLDVPIALGLAALYGRSLFEIVSGTGEGYLDSLAGLVFFLLCGKIFQQKTYDRLAFDADYKRFFPLSVTRRKSREQTGRFDEEQVAISQLNVGDHLVLRHGELIPADARLVEGPARIDYSFVTGEADPVEKEAGDHLFAGGRQVGGSITVETIKPVSQSYLTSLWNDAVFHKETDHNLESLTNRFGKYFTLSVIFIALAAGCYWWMHDAGLALKAFTSVLIVACPCALALSAPFALGTALRLLTRSGVFLKNTLVLERLARVDSVVLDKTGTLTTLGAGGVLFRGQPLTEREICRVRSLTRHSTHPHSVRIGNALPDDAYPESVGSFLEIEGQGLSGEVEHRQIRLGSRNWLEAAGIGMPRADHPAGSAVHLAMDGTYRGTFVLANMIRPGVERLARELAPTHDLTLLSGDNDRDSARFETLLGFRANLLFNQSPANKLEFIRQRQNAGQTVMMVGDGLNDAGALKQSDVGVAVVERAGTFTPASDVILETARIGLIPGLIRYARRAVNIVRLCFVISLLYNLVGVSFAAAGMLSPLICAILMPVSSISVVLVACGAAKWAARGLGVEPTKRTVTLTPSLAPAT